MAITKLLKIKSASSGKTSSGLLQCLRYIANPEKTEQMLLIGGTSGGDPDLTYADMIANKESWGKTSGTQGYHYILSLPPDEHPNTVKLQQLTEEFCKELLREKHLYAYAIHTDKNHLHSHIVFDSVSLEDGHMWKSGKYDWLARIQPITDMLCRKFGLRTLDFDPDNRIEKKNQTHAEWENATQDPLMMKKEISWTEIIRRDIDDVLSCSRTWSDFIARMIDNHYEVKDGVHLSLRPEGKERFVRSGRLGDFYAKEALMKRIGVPVQTENSYGDSQPMLQAIREFFQKTGTENLSEFGNRYYQRWYAYSYVNQSQTPWKYKKDLVTLGKYTDRCAYMFRHDITSEENLQRHLQTLQDKKNEIKKELMRVNNQIYNTPISSWRKLEKLRKQMQSASEVDRPMLQTKMDQIMTMLKDTDIVAGAERYRDLQEKKVKLQEISKKLTAELSMASDLLVDFGKSKFTDDVMQDPNRYEPEAFTTSSYQRITVNQILFRDSSEDKDFMKVKIPSRDECILLYTADTKLAADGSFASSYIYDYVDYRIIDDENRQIRTVTGTEVMKYFTELTKERRVNHAR